MQLLEMPRKPRGRREEIKATYRLHPDVKGGVERTAEIANRSENLHAEYLLKLGLLAIAGVNVVPLTQQQVAETFNEIYGLDSEESKPC